ncbi:neutral/alkaline non-lysosomal ceramidase N-terminal domain-containing protein [Larkinella soli]|uniref:neutral/alkaline non-lysosomal ceramidase N-terminal domain-containing protein n=1 Tax=Larkinella soli TaxID=1770527 RepID=UPI000FFC6DFC|nr:neutral/alkaline non-lysosomal ceramidase N-terminal domain-containing protein [Larkinella soli]
MSRRLTTAGILCFWMILLLPAWAQKPAGGWKAGVARVVITPEQPMWMAGYAARNHPAEGKLHDLWAKALALEDETGKRAVLVTTDLLGFPKGLSDRIRERLRTGQNLSKAQVILSSSHTHSGPVLKDALYDIYPLEPAELAKVADYTRRLEDQVVALIGQAVKNLEPVRLFAANGVTRFQVNRRNNREAVLRDQSELKGPNDYAVPVIRVEDAKGGLKAVVFGYACHPTVLDTYQWSGDYVGFAQLELEKGHPGATALFFQGAGGDQNPLPRRTVPLARQYGRELAAAVDRVLEDAMRELPAGLTTAYTEVDLRLAPPPSESELAKMTTEGESYMKRWAARMLTEKKQGKPVLTSYPYPVQLWKLGDQPLLSLGGEVVVGYAVELKRRFGREWFVMGYSNDVMGYIPTHTVLQEGGYEGASSQMVYGLPSVWDASIETAILQAVTELAGQAGIPKP